MTLQVGMLGTDGVILAGDTRLLRTPKQGISAPWMFYSGPKMKISQSGRVAVSCARDMQTGSNVAEAIFAGMTHGVHPGCEPQIQEIAVAAASGRDFECLIAFSDPIPSLYLFQYADNGKDIECQRILSCSSIGDRNNPAVFWGMRYYQLVPIDQLKNLAACMIVAAGTLNSGTINGLEIVFCTKQGCQVMTPELVGALQTRANAKLEAISEIVLAG